MTFEYKVVPAPTRGKRAKGARSAAERFANALSMLINSYAADGWEYLRTDTLPAEERQGLTGRTTVFQNMLVFRRQSEAEAPADTASDDAPASNDEAAHTNPDVKLSIDDLGETGAPNLPSAEAAQDVPIKTSARLGFSGKRNVAAE